MYYHHSRYEGLCVVVAGRKAFVGEVCLHSYDKHDSLLSIFRKISPCLTSTIGDINGWMNVRNILFTPKTSKIMVGFILIIL
mmetsp:Transcript_52327/g.59424  ORF Transcript_52327/g.59424 Transcript_52327/m.59424 type:complete len:82 (+) Transcript_52327:131-376(+)